ncbi:MAG: ClbS/DfsB family four-helix bundle protein [Chloroflexota bacterium]|nr:ClbS/DfsB family four-helix bundle protein [Chloroflexota bacterium]
MTAESVEPPSPPKTVAEMLERVDESWRPFSEAINRLPGERLGEQIGDGWTRKQMLGHIAAWHELTIERLVAFMADGQVHRLQEDDDVVNARVARRSDGRTAGEVVDAVETTFRRLRRQVAFLTDEQLAAHDGWAAAVIAGNTYEHYAEHIRDLES